MDRSERGTMRGRAPAAGTKRAVGPHGAAHAPPRGRLGFLANRGLIEHMLHAARELGVDFESLALWGVLLHENVAHRLPSGSLPTVFLDEPDRVPTDARALRPIRVNELARISGIPRETVRRRLLRLEADRRVERVADGWVIRLASIEPRWHALTNAAVERLRATVRDIDASLVEGAGRGDGVGE